MSSETIVVTPHIYIEDFMNPKRKKLEMKEQQSAPIVNTVEEVEDVVVTSCEINDKLKYVKVQFQSCVEQDFIDSINEQLDSIWLHKWFKCPAEKCKNYYLPTQLTNMRNHIVDEWWNKSHNYEKWWIDDETLDMSYVKTLYAMKREKYDRLLPKLKCVMLLSSGESKIARKNPQQKKRRSKNSIKILSQDESIQQYAIKILSQKRRHCNYKLSQDESIQQHSQKKRHYNYKYNILIDYY